MNLLRLLALVLVVMGCSQPVPRDPAPRAKDAATPDAMSVDAAAVTDAAVTDAAVPVDAAPDMEGHWKFLRSRRVPGDMMRTAAIVVRQETRAAGVFIKLDRGRDYGVKKGWKGRFINDDGKLVFDVFEVSDVERSSATASTTATSDMVANTRRVILWDPEHGDENGW